MNLFQTTVKPTHLVEFNAGKCIRDGSLIKPDLRKGQIYMDQGDDQLLHLYWKERKSEAINEDNLIIFPEEAEFKQVTECTTGRVFLLRFKNSGDSHFYWMQSKNQEKDQEILERVNELIHDPESNINSHSSSAEDGFATHADLMNFMSDAMNQNPNLTRDDLLQYLNQINESVEGQDEDEDEDMEANLFSDPDSNTPPAPAPANTSTPLASVETSSTSTSAPTPAATADVPASTVEVSPTFPSTNTLQHPSSAQLDQFREMLANVRPTGPPISLNDVLTTQAITPLLNDPEICASLIPFLPDELDQSEEQVQHVVRSPQFSQALQSLSAALQTGQLGPLLTQLGLDASAGNSVESFLIALGEQAKQKKNKQGSNAMEED